MNARLLRNSDFAKWIQSMLDAGDRVVAPVRAAEEVLFSRIERPEEVALDAGMTTKSAKGVFFPQSEVILRFSRKDGRVRVEDVEGFAPPTVLLGVRPCDAAGLSVLDSVFQWDYRDRFYMDRRERTTLVVLGCAGPVDDACFCTSVGLGPDSRQGADVFIAADGRGGRLVEAVTAKGERLLERTPGLFEDAQPAAVREPREVVPLRFRKEAIKPWLDEHFDDPLWKEMTLRCVGCGTCAFLCPTCHCFDIVDEERLGEGVRRKNWDSCQFGLFTVHASGHNPRGDQAARFRQRLMHKFKYYVEKFGSTLCVGCGRCVRACPTGNSILDYLTEIDRRMQASGSVLSGEQGGRQSR